MNKLENLLQSTNKKVESILIKYGLIIAISLLVCSVILIRIYYPDKWIEACSVTIAIISVFVMIVIMYMNNQTIRINTQKQIDTFEQQTKNQIESFNREIDKQIESFKQMTEVILKGLNDVAKTQEITSDRQIESFKTEVGKLIEELEKVNTSQKDFVKVSLVQTESFIRQTNLIKDGLDHVSNDVNKGHHVSKANTEKIVRTIDNNEPAGNIILRGIGEIIEGIGGHISTLWKKIKNL